MDTRTGTWLGPLAADVDAACARLRRERVVERVLDRDYRVWGDDPAEIANRLAWLDSPQSMAPGLASIRAQIAAAVAAGCRQCLLLGMGGSSLAPEVFRRTFGVAPGHLDLAVLDSTHPLAVQMALARGNPAETLYLAATKSGGTVETMSLTRYAYNQAAAALGREQAGAHFAAITDPGSGLADLARELGFRHIFLNDPDIGGRFSALSYFGLVAAGAIGVDLDRLLARAREMDPHLASTLGAVMGTAALAGRDKLTLVLSPGIAAFGAWVEQLVAESTGKQGRGILPVDGEADLDTDVYGSDRLFVYLRLADDGDAVRTDARLGALAAAGHPVYRIDLTDPYDLGGEFMRWEWATAVAGYLLGINPFDQPDVEAAKVSARAMVQAYREQGVLPALVPMLRQDEVAVYGDGQATSLAAALTQFLANPATYVALQAYLAPTPATDAGLAALRQAIGRRTRCATTVGYGPRFLHSTGQLHKGDAGRGLFLQLVAPAGLDTPIPDRPGEPASTMSFGVLIAAQALGDRQALLQAGRRVLRVDLGPNPEAGLARLLAALA